MPLNWEKIKKTVKGELSDAAIITKKYLNIGKVQLAMMNSNDSLNGTFRELGIEVYNQIAEEKKGDIRHNQKVKNLIGKVSHLKQSINDEKLEIQALKEGTHAQINTKENSAKSPAVRARKTV
jgi:hypothetical protein